MLNKEDLEGQFSKLVEGLSDAKSAADMVTVLYGSETGNAEEQAKNLMQDIRARGLKAQVSSVDDFDFDELPNQKIVAWLQSLKWTCHAFGMALAWLLRGHPGDLHLRLGRVPREQQADLVEAAVPGSAHELALGHEVRCLRPW